MVESARICSACKKSDIERDGGYVELRLLYWERNYSKVVSTVYYHNTDACRLDLRTLTPRAAVADQAAADQAKAEPAEHDRREFLNDTPRKGEQP